jgi:predicted lipoprotein with Yx(FWY)xxD motif
MRAIKTYISTILGVVAVAVFISAASAETLSVQTKDGLGTFLANEKGITLYLFKKDAPGKSVCGTANGCIGKWPVYFADAIAKDAGINEQAVGSITRDDGVKQTTYNGMPLYYFFKDKDKGDTNGQGVNNVWYVVAP